MIDSSTKREVLKIFVKRKNVQRTMIERNDDVQKTLRIKNDSQFLIKFRKKKNSIVMLIDVVLMNIKS
jgi:hypothetical protein